MFNLLRFNQTATWIYLESGNHIEYITPNLNISLVTVCLTSTDSEVPRIKYRQNRSAPRCIFHTTWICEGQHTACALSALNPRQKAGQLSFLWSSVLLCPSNRNSIPHTHNIFVHGSTRNSRVVPE